LTGYDRGLWAELPRYDEAGADYLSEKLLKTGRSVQQPVRAARECEEALVIGVAPGTLAPDQKKAKRRPALIIFVDETGFSFQLRLARTSRATRATASLAA
jgi:hypothetical protein